MASDEVKAAVKEKVRGLVDYTRHILDEVIDGLDNEDWHKADAAFAFLFRDNLGDNPMIPLVGLSMTMIHAELHRNGDEGYAAPEKVKEIQDRIVAEETAQIPDSPAQWFTQEGT